MRSCKRSWLVLLCCWTEMVPLSDEQGRQPILWTPPRFDAPPSSRHQARLSREPAHNGARRFAADRHRRMSTPTEHANRARPTELAVSGLQMLVPADET